MTHGGAHASFDGTGIEPGVDPMYYLMAIGLISGIIVVIAFEHFTAGWSMKNKRLRYKSITSRFRAINGESPDFIDPDTEKKLSKCVDGANNIFHFWTGVVLVSPRPTKAAYAKTFETLAVLCALLFTCSVAFYVEVPGDHLYGLVGCVANCTLWMDTLMSTFLAVAINACENDEQLELLSGLYGRFLLRVPMLLFAWGSFLIFFQFVLFFKLNVDPGFNCSLCLGACLVLFPTFLHCLHKLGWASSIVHGEAEAERKRAEALKPEEVHEHLRTYVAAKGKHNILNLDRDEFLKTFNTLGGCETSVLKAYAVRVFNAYVEKEFQRIHVESLDVDDIKVESKDADESTVDDVPFELKMNSNLSCLSSL